MGIPGSCFICYYSLGAKIDKKIYVMIIISQGLLVWQYGIRFAAGYAIFVYIYIYMSGEYDKLFF